MQETQHVQTNAVSAEPARPSRSYKPAYWVTAAVLLLLLPLGVYRAAIENSLSIDETFSLMVATYPFADIIELTQVDQHPPGFYLVLKAWNELGTALGLQPSVLWARTPSVITWCILALIVGWFAARRLHPVNAILLLLAICGCCGAGDAFRSTGIYAIPFAAIGIMFVLLISEITATSSGLPERRALGIARLAAYAACGAAALWVHLLAGVAIAVLAAIWIVACLKGTNKRLRLTRAIGTQVSIAVLFLPWALRISGQLAAFRNDPRSWTTPPSLSNLLRVFTIWYPYGSMGETTNWVRWWHVALGAASFALPLAFALFAHFGSRKRARPDASIFYWIASVGLLAAIGNVLILWGLKRLGIAHTWHGPRYAVFTSGLWWAGLVGMTSASVARVGWKPIVGLLILAPWLACTVLGQIWGIGLERSSGLANWKASIPNFPVPGDAVFVMPTELMPYHKHALATLNAQPIEKLFDVSSGTTDVAVLNLNPWPGTDKLSNVFVRAVVNSGKLSERLEQRKIPNNVIGYTLHWLRGFHHDYAAQMRSLNFAPPPPPIPAAAVAVALNQYQRLSDGWSSLNATTSLYTTRTARPPMAQLRFRQSVPAGKYTLHFVGQYFGPRGSTANFTIHPRDEQFSYQFSKPAGSVSIAVPMQLTHLHQPLVLEIVPPETNMAAPVASRTELHFFFAWLEKA